MTVIEITLIESEIEVVSGIPRSISIEVNIPSTVFYTLDGSTPTTDSDIYISPITLPTTNPTLVFKAYATNGTDSSAIITETYAPNTVKVKHFQALTTDPVNSASSNIWGAFGDNPNPPSPRIGEFGGITVDDPRIPNYPDGYDGTGTNTYVNGTDLPLSEYDIIYSETNRKGEYGKGIGTVPATTTVRIAPIADPSSSSHMSSKFFNPKAMIIYQDSSVPPYDPNIGQLNREFFTLTNIERDKDGQAITNTAFEGNVVTGSALKPFYNPTDHTITFFYRDRDSGRWIICKEQYTPKNDNIGALYKMKFGKNSHVYSWPSFQSRKLW